MVMMKSSTSHRSVLIISPQASRLGHGAIHGQRTLEAFARQGEWETVFLTGRSFRDRTINWSLYGQVIEDPEDFGSIGGYRGSIQAIQWGIRRRRLQDKFLRRVDEIIPSSKIKAVLVLDGDIQSIYYCWLRNNRVNPGVAWVIAHSTVDFWFSELSVRSFFKWYTAPMVRKMSEGMGATVLYTGSKVRDEYCSRLNLSKEARDRIVLTQFGCDPEDLRLSKIKARQELNIPEDAKVALFFGLIRTDKRPEVALTATVLAGDSWWLLMAGMPYSYSVEDLTSLVSNSDIKDRSRLILNYLTEDEVRLVFSAADILLLTHDRGIVSNSGPLSMARSYRLPVIVSDVGSLREIVQQDGTGWVANPGEPSSYASRLIEFANLTIDEVSLLEHKIERAAYRNSFDSTVRDYSRALNIAIDYTKKHDR
jgi:glycosyltransferase involved in cell wall biosynthesis